MKRFMVFFMAIALCLSLFGCGRNAMVGAWTTEIDGTEVTFVFEANGKVTISGTGAEGKEVAIYEGTCQIDGDTYSFTPDNPEHRPESGTFQRSGEQLILNFDADPGHSYQEKTLVLTRKK